jgi:hypothetical protein
MTTKYPLYNSVYRYVVGCFSIHTSAYESSIRAVNNSVYSGVHRAISWSIPPFPAVYSAIIDTVYEKMETLCN